MALFSTEGETVSFTKVRLALVYEGGWQAHPLGGALPPPRTFTRRVVWIVLCVLCLPCVAASAKKGVIRGSNPQSKIRNPQLTCLVPPTVQLLINRVFQY